MCGYVWISYPLSYVTNRPERLTVDEELVKQISVC